MQQRGQHVHKKLVANPPNHKRKVVEILVSTVTTRCFPHVPSYIRQTQTPNN